MRRAAAMLVVLAATALPARPAAASAPPMVGRLAVGFPDTLVMVIGSDGSSPVRLDAGRRSVNAYTIAWSPDGTRVAVADWYIGSQGDASGVDVFDVASGGKDVVWTYGRVIAPAWSPDGRRLAYVTSDETGHTVETAASGGCCRRRVLSAPELQIGPRPAWSADGRFLHVIADDMNGGELDDAVLRVPVTGGAAKRLLPDLDAYEVKVSPGGRHLALCATGPAGFGVYVARADGTGVRRLGSLACGGGDGSFDVLAWSPDGTELAVASDGIVHRVDARTGAATPLTGSLGAHTVSWSPEGTWLAFTGSGGAWVVGADGTGLARVPGTDGAREVYFSPVP